MSANPGTYASFLTTGRSPSLAARAGGANAWARCSSWPGRPSCWRRSWSIPLFLTASILPWTPLPAGAWAGLGVLLAGTLKAAICALLVALPLGIATAIFTRAVRGAGVSRAGSSPALEMLEAIPTVVLGLIAFATLSPWLKTNVGTLLALLIVAARASAGCGHGLR